MTKTTKELAEEWLRLDKDEATRDEIYKLLVRGDDVELERRLRTRIAFGTAGLRGPMQAGFSCIFRGNTWQVFVLLLYFHPALKPSFLRVNHGIITRLLLKP